MVLNTCWVDELTTAVMQDGVCCCLGHFTALASFERETLIGWLVWPSWNVSDVEIYCEGSLQRMWSRGPRSLQNSMRIVSKINQKNIHVTWRISSSGMLRRVVLVRTDVSVESSVSFISVTRIGELGTALAVTSNRRTLVFFLVHRFLSPWWKRR
jgi:hypothetical protein